MRTSHYCTYFDHRYLSRGLALHASLQRHGPGSVLWVLALSEECEQALRELALPGLRIVPLGELEAADPALAAARKDRSLVEYYFTCTPCLCRHVLASDPAASSVTYLDADLYFFGPPDPVLEELGEASVGLVPHRFTPRSAASHGRFGKYNVGWVGFRRDQAGQAAVDWWRGQCLAWCHDRVEGDRYADQKYLERFEILFAGVHVIYHPGANVAPWNVAGVHLHREDGRVMVDGQALVFFHFQGLRRLADGRFDSNLTGYGATMTPLLREAVFRPYLAELLHIESELARRLPAFGVEPGIRRQAAGWLGAWRTAKAWLSTARAGLAGNLVRP